MISYELLFLILKIGIISFLVNIPFGTIRSRFFAIFSILSLFYTFLKPYIINNVENKDNSIIFFINHLYKAIDFHYNINMISYELLFLILKIGIISFIVNIPFGMIRSRFQSYSIMWFLSIHAPIPVAAVLRRSAGLSFWYLFIFMVFGIAGQVLGKKIALKYFPQK